jgi:hypothetical protein
MNVVASHVEGEVMPLDGGMRCAILSWRVSMRPIDGLELNQTSFQIFCTPSRHYPERESPRASLSHKFRDLKMPMPRS